jgi:biotin-(acetyl-CoA carboxylase) ligase
METTETNATETLDQYFRRLIAEHHKISPDQVTPEFIHEMRKRIDRFKSETPRTYMSDISW